MGAPELHLSSPPAADGAFPGAAPQGGAASAFRRFDVSGESMEFFLRTGDRLLVELPKDRQGSPAAPGDLLLFIGCKGSAMLLAHRVLGRLPFGGALLTKGDFHFLPDAPAARASWLGAARAAERGERRVYLDCGWSRAAGFALALYSLPCVFLYRAVQFLLWVLRGTVSAGSGGAEPWALLAALETWHLRVLRPLLRALPDAVFAALARHSERRHGGALAAILAHVGEEEPSRPLAGEVSGVLEVSGEARVCGDLVVLPGAELLLRPGARLVFQEGKRFHHGIRRRWEGVARDLTEPARPQIIVYGTLSALGEPGAPVRFESAGGGSLLLVGGGSHRIRHAESSGLSLRCLDRVSLSVSGSRFGRGSEPSLRAGGRARVVLRDCVFADGWGAVAAHEHSFVSLSRCAASGNRTAFFATGDALLRLTACTARAAGGPGLREGVRLEARARARSWGLRVEGYPVGVLLRGSSRARLRGCRARANGLGVFAEQSARLLLSRSRVSGSRTHGLWVKDAAAARVAGSALSRNAHNGVYATEKGRLSLERSSLSRNRTGVSLEGTGRVALDRCRLSDNRERNLHSDRGLFTLEECRLTGAQEGILLGGKARVSLSGGSVRRAAQAGLRLREESRAALSGARLAETSVGVLVEDAARLQVRGGALAGNTAHGALLRGKASALLEGAAVTGNRQTGLFAAEDSSLRLDDCFLAEQPLVGLKAIERAKVELRGGVCENNGNGLVVAEDACLALQSTQVRGNRGHGIWLADRAAAALRAVGFQANGDNGLFAEGDSQTALADCRFAAHERAGLAAASQASLESDGSVFDDNGIGLLLWGSARLRFRKGEVLRSRVHGVWLKGSSAARLEGTAVRGSAHNGVYVAEAARFEAAEAVWEGGGCGLSCEGESRAALGDCRFSGQGSLGASFSGGEHSLRGCKLEEAPVGVSVRGDARVTLSDCRLVAHPRTGLSAAGSSRVDLQGGSVERSGVGIAAADTAALELRGVEVRGSLGHGAWLRGSCAARFHETVFLGSRDNGVFVSEGAALEASGGRFGGNRCGLACDGESRAVLRESRFEGNTVLNASLSGGRHRLERCEFSAAPDGVSVSGTAVAALLHCGVRRHEGEGLCASGEAEASVQGGSFEGNGTGIGVSEAARLDLEEARVTGNRRFGLWARDGGTAALLRCVLEGNDGAGAYAEGEPAVDFREGELRENRGHGVWAAGGARIRMTGTRIRSNAENGLFGDGKARFHLERCELGFNRCGVAAKGAARVRAAHCAFDRQAVLGLDFGGASRLILSSCELRNTPQGLALQGTASAVADRVRFAHLGRGAVLTGRARAVFRDVLWRANEVGLWCQEESACRVRGGSFRGHSSEALRAGQGSRAEAFGVRFAKNCMAVLLEDRCAVLLRSCAFRLNPTGVKADGACRLAVERCRLRGCVLDGVWIGRETAGSVTGCDFRCNRIGLHHHFEASPRLSANTFLQNQYGDVRRFPEEAFS